MSRVVFLDLFFNGRVVFLIAHFMNSAVPRNPEIMSEGHTPHDIHRCVPLGRLLEITHRVSVVWHLISA